MSNFLSQIYQFLPKRLVMEVTTYSLSLSSLEQDECGLPCQSAFQFQDCPLYLLFWYFSSWDEERRDPLSNAAYLKSCGVWWSQATLHSARDKDSCCILWARHWNQRPEWNHTRIIQTWIFHFLGSFFSEWTRTFWSPVVSFEAEYVLLHHRVEIALPALNQEYLEIGWNSVCYLLQTPRNSTRISKQHYSWDARTSHPHYSHWSQRVTHSCADTPPWRKINLSSDSTTPTLWYRIYAFLRVKVSLCIFELWSEKCGHWNEAHCVWLFSFLLRTRFQ